MFLDLDGFKQVNDTWGHKAGDEVLKQFAMRQTDAVRASDTVARLAGDEFVVVLGAVGDDATIETVAARILAATQIPITGDGFVAHAGVSIGVSVAPRDGRDAAALVQKADAAMYQGEAAGKKRGCRVPPQPRALTSANERPHDGVGRCCDHGDRHCHESQRRRQCHWNELRNADQRRRFVDVARHHDVPNEADDESQPLSRPGPRP